LDFLNREKSRRLTRFSHAEHVQPTGMIFSTVLSNIVLFDISLLPFAYGEIDLACALGAPDVHAETQRPLLKVSIHDSDSFNPGR
jgi:hypothetical protein